MPQTWSEEIIIWKYYAVALVVQVRFNFQGRTIELLAFDSLNFEMIQVNFHVVAVDETATTGRVTATVPSLVGRSWLCKSRPQREQLTRREQ